MNGQRPEGGLLAGLRFLPRVGGGGLSLGKTTTLTALIRTALLATATGLLTANFTASTAWAQAAYTVTDLGTLGGSSSFALGINASGQVVGKADLADGTTHAFLYSDSTMTDLGALGGNDSIARGINASGQVVGSVSPGDFTGHAFLYSGVTMADLGRSSDARGINASGQVVGGFETAGAKRAFLYSGSTLVDLGTFGGRDSEAFGINTRGHVVGNARYADDKQRAFLYADSILTDLGTVGGGGSSYATAINDNGQVVGGADIDDRGTSHAFRCNVYAGAIMNDLGCLGGTYNYSYASAINAIGQVVGASTFDDTGASHAFIYSSTMIDLNDLIPSLSGWTLCEAAGINDAGQIVGYGIINGQSHAFLLTPVVTVVVTFDAEGGTVSPASKDVTLDAAYGSLPTPSRAGGIFAGWWTGDNGTGTQVTSATLVTATADHTLHAKYSSADFVVTNLVLSPALPVVGGKFTATITVQNQGAMSGKAGYLYVWPDKPVTVAVGEMGEKAAALGTLKPGQTKTVKLTLTAPNTRGAFVLRAFADAKNVTPEDDESNNQGTYTYRTGLPDFVIVGVSLNPAIPVTGKTFIAYVTVKNTGDVAGNAGSLDLWAASPATKPVAGSKTKGNKYKTAGILLPGQQKTITVTGLKAPVGNAWTLGVLIDSRAKTLEMTETNNWFEFAYGSTDTPPPPPPPPPG